MVRQGGVVGEHCWPHTPQQCIRVRRQFAQSLGLIHGPQTQHFVPGSLFTLPFPHSFSEHAAVFGSSKRLGPQQQMPMNASMAADSWTFLSLTLLRQSLSPTSFFFLIRPPAVMGMEPRTLCTLPLNHTPSHTTNYFVCCSTEEKQALLDLKKARASTCAQASYLVF